MSAFRNETPRQGGAAGRSTWRDHPTCLTNGVISCHLLLHNRQCANHRSTAVRWIDQGLPAALHERAAFGRDAPLRIRRRRLSCNGRHGAVSFRSIRNRAAGRTGIDALRCRPSRHQRLPKRLRPSFRPPSALSTDPALSTPTAFLRRVGRAGMARPCPASSWSSGCRRGRRSCRQRRGSSLR